MTPVTTNRRRFLTALSMTVAVQSLTACGGGGGGDASATPPPAAGPTPPAPTPPAPTPPAPTPPAPTPPAPTPPAPTPPAPTPPAPAPAPTPAPTGARQFTLTSGVNAFVPFALGFCFKQGEIPNGRTVTAGALDVQVSVKNRWPDGSAKLAIIAGLAAAVPGVAQTIALQAAAVPGAVTPLSTADLRATGAVAIVDCGSFGSVTWSGSDWDAPASAWVAGPLMSSWIYRRPVGSDRHLVAWLEVRLFRGGAVEILPWVENGYLNVAGPSNKLADYGFTLGGVQRFAQRIDLPNHCRTPLLSGTALSHWLTTDPGVVVYCDTDYLQATELVPTYFADVPPTASIVTALPSSFSPLQVGSYPASMGSAGYDPSIGLLPEWDVIFLSSPSVISCAALQRNAYSAGRYGIHHRDETTNRPPRFSSYPTTVLGAGNGIAGIGSSSTNTFTPNATGTAPQAWNVSHHPSLGFMGYLLTGRFYHLETAQFAATANFLKSSDIPREGAAGVIQTWSSNTTRGAAWAVRTLAQAACITPDDDAPLRGEFIASFEANINRQHATYVAQANNAFGWMEPFSDYTFATGPTGAGSTSTAVDLTGGVGNVTGQYVGYELQIGGQVRVITAFNGVTKVATVAPPFGVPVAGVSFVLTDNTMFNATWMEDFYTAAVGYAKALQLTSGAVSAKLEAFFAWKAQSIVGRFGGAGASEYLYRDAAPFTVAIAKSDGTGTTQRDLGSVFRTGAGPWHANWGAVWSDTEAGRALDTGQPQRARELGDGTLRGTVLATSFWGNLQPGLSYAVRFGVPGAAAAMVRMKSAPNWATTLAPDFDRNPVWSVRPATP